ncbi:MAG: DUF1993 domain-containing protein [Alphaproteobacteria bacterium]|nr:DUF1993 domain-containing protein [Alphaproteobacteria bacterium]
MAFTIYDASIPPLVTMLENLGHVLTVGETHARDNNIEARHYLEARLAPDMFHLTKQVQVATDMAKGCGARLAGVEIPKYEDNESSFADLQARLAKTIAFLKGLDRASFEGAEDKPITLKFPNAEFHFNGRDYLNNFAMPNIYFHITMAYAILRHNGVPLGKQDFMGRRS